MLFNNSEKVFKIRVDYRWEFSGSISVDKSKR